MFIRFDCERFRIATMAQSTEETRYYLNGVYLTRDANPSDSDPGGRMVSTDGSKLLVIRDTTLIVGQEFGAGVIVQVAKADRNKLKPGKGAAGRIAKYAGSARTGQITLNLYDLSTDGDETLAGHILAELVDGSFPDFRRVIPQPSTGPCIAAFNHAVLATFADIAEAVGKVNGTRMSSLRFEGEDAGSPHLVHFEANWILGVAMPVREKSCNFVEADSTRWARA